jgi:hypothetical protein
MSGEIYFKHTKLNPSLTKAVCQLCGMVLIGSNTAVLAKIEQQHAKRCPMARRDPISVQDS